MAEFVLSPNMSLPVPIVSLTPGANYAFDVNNCLSLIDQHTHAFGSGVQITPNGLNINSDLTVQNNNLTNIRSARFFSQSSPISGVNDIDCLYVSGVDLYYNDGLTNIVRITQNGGVAGSPGSIANLTSPASASYSAGTSTFIWESDASTAANMDGGSVIIRQILANAKGITLASPNALSNDYTITLLPALPGSSSFLTIDSSGNLGTTATSSFNPNFAVSSSSGAYTTTSTSAVAVTNMSVTITTTGNPVMIGFRSDVASVSYLGVSSSFNQFAAAFYKIQRDAVDVYEYEHYVFDNTLTSFDERIPPGVLNTFDDGASAGTHTYTLQVAQIGSVGNTVSVNNVVMYVYEIK